jgi:hypothetical protein
VSKNTSVRYRVPEETRPLASLPCSALRQSFREGYSHRELKGDILAGRVVGVVALLLSMALSIGVNAPPQQGLNTAIVAGLLVALESALQHLERQKVLTILSGVQWQPRRLLTPAKIREQFKALRIRSEINDALDLAGEHVNGSARPA